MSKELKILINNEEVVCDKQISIDEKMLSTSSTILKNCYPKFWETDKDYTSRFYFPKDYSKCRISYDEFHPEEQGEIVTGTNLTINYDITKNFELLQLQGNTYQQTYTGKNLCGIPDQTFTHCGVQVTIKNGEITLNGTSTSTGTKQLTPIKTTTLNGTYVTNYIYVSGTSSTSVGATGNFNLRNANGGAVISGTQLALYTNNSKAQFTISSDTSIIFGIYIQTIGVTYNNLKFKPQLIKGTSEDYSYEPYVGGTPSPNPDYPQSIQNVTGRQTIDVVGKNLFDKSVTPSSQNGTTTTELDTGIRAKVTATGQNKYTAINLKNPSNLLGKTLTISATITPSGTNNALIRVYWLNGNTLTSLISNTISTTGSYTFTIPSSFPTNKNGIALVFSSNASSGTSQIGDYVDYTNVQLEIGSTATTYEEYKRQSYEINLGKNLFDKDNANVLNAYFNTSTNKLTQSGAGVKSLYIPCKPNTTYTVQKTLSTRFGVACTREIPVIGETIYNASVHATWNNITITTDSQAKYLVVEYYISSDTLTSEEIMDTIQIETGSQATTYSEYFTPIELNKISTYKDYIRKSTGKNLFDKDNLNELTSTNIDSSGTITTTSGCRTIYIPIKSNTTYTISKIPSTRFRVATYTDTPQVGSTTSNYTANITTGNTTITSGANDKYLAVWLYYVSTDTLTYQQIIDTVQIEEGSTATDPEPYGVGKWYICNKIGKYIFDGSTNAFGYSSSNSVFVTDTLSTLIKKNTTMIANYYNQVDNTTTYANMTTGQMKLDGTNSGRIIIKDTRYTSANDYKIWLQSNNLILYYVLSTPTYTEITNTDLINQLESIELLNGINNITVTSPNVPGALKIHYNFKEAYTESDLVFCGVVKNTGNISLNPREPHYVDLQILDFKCLLSEGETLNYVINDKTIPEAIEQVVASISDYGFVIGNINILNPNDKINAYSTLNKTAYDVFQYIADVTQSKWATRVIDEDTIAIDFYDPTLMPQASPIEYNQTYFENNDIENMTFNYSTNDYRNKQIMTSDEVFGNIEQIETIISNGYQDTYTCQNKIGIIKKITVNDVECTFATKNEVELGVTADFIYQPGEIVFTSSQIYTSGSVIVITYLPIIKGREIVLNNEESSRISSQINRKGTISRYENRNDTTSGQELIKIGQSYIKYKGSAEITLKIVSSKNLFNVGQIVEFNAPLEELSTEYMVKNKIIDIWTIDSNETQVFYTYELSSNFNSENAINYFDNQRAKNQGNIGEGETIVRNIDIENTALIQFYETNIEEVEISNISTLDFSLDAVLI